MENRFDKILLKSIETLTLALLVFMFVVVISAVFSRYVLNSPIFWSEELASYLMVYMVMLGSAVAFRKGKHPVLLFIVQKFSVRFQEVWNFILDIMIIIISIVIFKEGYLMALNESIMKTSALRISFFWVYLALPVGAMLTISQIIVKFIFSEKKLFKLNKKNS